MRGNAKTSMSVLTFFKELQVADLGTQPHSQ